MKCHIVRLQDAIFHGLTLTAGITDAEPGTPGIQYVDVGAISAGSTWYYLLTTVNGCGESADWAFPFENLTRGEARTLACQIGSP